MAMPAMAPLLRDLWEVAVLDEVADGEAVVVAVAVTVANAVLARLAAEAEASAGKASPGWSM